jgi:hypothetical protein
MITADEDSGFSQYVTIDIAESAKFSSNVLVYLPDLRGVHRYKAYTGAYLYSVVGQTTGFFVSPSGQLISSIADLYSRTSTPFLLSYAVLAGVVSLLFVFLLVSSGIFFLSHLSMFFPR